MPFCPQCEYEYVEGVKICADCEVELVDTLEEEQEDEFECDRCSHPVNEKDRFCKNCGALFEDNAACEKHPEKAAEYVCLICESPLCGNCKEEVSGKSFCSMHCNYDFTESSWAVVYTTNHRWDVELKKNVLTSNEIPCLVDSKQDTARGLYVGLLSEIRLMVPFEHVLSAEKYLKEE